MSNRSGVATSRTAAPRLRTDHVRRLIDAAQDSHSASTRRNYLAAWRRFQSWAEGEGFHPIPALPETVAAYLAERAANGLSPASLRMDRAAIRYHHTEAGHANPTDNEGVRRVELPRLDGHLSIWANDGGVPWREDLAGRGDIRPSTGSN